ncbi:hypothetical protein ACH0CV_05920 [Brachybacterium paraconglomeratum]|uniref:hypothetical protein n=1 Tax=Brachybacterium paraconglomeratum TaxID=173362 RepID=UPI003879AE29
MDHAGDESLVAVLAVQLAVGDPDRAVQAHHREAGAEGAVLEHRSPSVPALDVGGARVRAVLDDRVADLEVAVEASVGERVELDVDVRAGELAGAAVAVHAHAVVAAGDGQTAAEAVHAAQVRDRRVRRRPQVDAVGDRVLHRDPADPHHLAVRAVPLPVEEDQGGLLLLVAAERALLVDRAVDGEVAQHDRTRVLLGGPGGAVLRGEGAHALGMVRRAEDPRAVALQSETVLDVDAGDEIDRALAELDGPRARVAHRVDRGLQRAGVVRPAVADGAELLGRPGGAVRGVGSGDGTVDGIGGGCGCLGPAAPGGGEHGGESAGESGGAEQPATGGAHRTSRMGEAGGLVAHGASLAAPPR